MIIAAYAARRDDVLVGRLTCTGLERRNRAYCSPRRAQSANNNAREQCARAVAVINRIHQRAKRDLRAEREQSRRDRRSYNIKKREEVQEMPQEEPNPLMRKKKTPEELAAEAEAEDEDEFTSK